MKFHIPSLKRFGSDRSGNVGIMFALLSMPMMGLMGAALDLSRAISTKTQLQAIVDAAALSGAVEYRHSGDPAAVENRIENMVANEVAGMGLSLDKGSGNGAQGGDVILSDAEFNAGSSTIAPVLSTNVPTTVLKIFGYDDIPVEVTTTAQLSGKNLELSVMLDVTGSMYGTKLANLKLASNDLLDMFRVNLTAGTTRIALVPFSESVNLGPGLAGTVRAYPSRTKKFQPRGRGNQRWTYNLTTCVTERNGNHRFTNDAPGPGRYMSPMYSSNGSCRPSQQIVPLTSDENFLRTVVDGLYAGGSTAGHLGTAWAWYTISETWADVFDAGSKPAPADPDKLIKASILMTDGAYNTEYCRGVNDSTINCNSPNGNSAAQAEALCRSMKEDGVVIYAVGFGISQGSSQDTLLKNCASGADKYFVPYDGDALREAFQEIGRQLVAGQAGIRVIN